MSRSEKDIRIIKSILRGFVKTLLDEYDPRTVLGVLHVALDEAFGEALSYRERRAESEERMPELSRPVVIEEVDPRSLARAISYQSEGIYRLQLMSHLIHDVAARTLSEAEMSLKGKCLFCNGNMELEVKQLPDGTKKVYLSCLKQGSSECADYIWEIGDVTPIHR